MKGPRPAREGCRRQANESARWEPGSVGSICAQTTGPGAVVAAAALQGLPYSISGTGDLLALFRCISCKYKFSTDLTKPQLMGAGELGSE